MQNVPIKFQNKKGILGQSPVFTLFFWTSSLTWTTSIRGSTITVITTEKAVVMSNVTGHIISNTFRISDTDTIVTFTQMTVITHIARGTVVIVNASWQNNLDRYQEFKRKPYLVCIHWLRSKYKSYHEEEEHCKFRQSSSNLSYFHRCMAFLEHILMKIHHHWRHSNKYQGRGNNHHLRNIHTQVY